MSEILTGSLASYSKEHGKIRTWLSENTPVASPQIIFNTKIKISMFKSEWPGQSKLQNGKINLADQRMALTSLISVMLEGNDENL